MLEVSGLFSGYGGATVLHGVDLELSRGEIVALLGHNGAGKTTTLRAISGQLEATAGRVALAGEDITNLRPDRIVALGLTHVPEGRRVFPGLTVEDNLRAGAHLRRLRAKELREAMSYPYDLFPRLGERRTQFAGTLSGGEQQMLAIGRALMSQPRVLMVDEASLGLAPLMVDLVYDTLERLNKEGLTLLLVEQYARIALSLASRGYVLDQGSLVAEGGAEDLRRSGAIEAAYLGQGEEAPQTGQSTKTVKKE